MKANSISASRPPTPSTTATTNTGSTIWITTMTTFSRKDSEDIYAQLDRLDKRLNIELEDLLQMGLLDDDITGADINKSEDDSRAAEDESTSQDNNNNDAQRLDLQSQDVEQIITISSSSRRKINSQRRKNGNGVKGSRGTQSNKSTNPAQRRNQSKQPTQETAHLVVDEKNLMKTITSPSRRKQDHQQQKQRNGKPAASKETAPSKDTTNKPGPDMTGRKTRIGRSRLQKEPQKQDQQQNGDELSNANPVVETGEKAGSYENISSSKAKDELVKDTTIKPGRGERRERNARDMQSLHARITASLNQSRNDFLSR